MEFNSGFKGLSGEIELPN